ncbi:MAG TPA: hypothetical protein ENJ96_05275 [Thermodesulfatator atlanticus]|uniref:Uncharacterized protein n=1 Tax=Thermodesulfatator atlanticus TaxID=501497 RepID=A0A7V5U2S4_9BACT|nr:hypothetical protein [Thermodesulfatator atlanticus]
MKWPSFTLKEKIELGIGICLCILFGVRYYPENLSKTLLESLRWIFGFFFYSGVFTYMLRGLCRKIFKQTFSFKTGIKMAVWLAVASAIAQSIHETIKIYQHPTP